MPRVSSQARARCVHVDGPGNDGHRVGDAGAREARVGDERVEPGLAVVVDAQPGHVPAGVIGVPDAEDRETRWDRPARATARRTTACRAGVDVARRPVREQLGVAALQPGSLGAVRDDRDLAGEVRLGRAAGRIVGGQSAAGRQVEQQAVRAGRLPAGAAPSIHRHDPMSSALRPNPHAMEPPSPLPSVPCRPVSVFCLLSSAASLLLATSSPTPPTVYRCRRLAG